MDVYAHEPSGFEGCLVKVEVDIRRGIPGIDLVGLAAATVRESKERVRAAIRNAGYRFPQDRVLISLSPPDLPKYAASYDLPIAVKILAQAGLIPERSGRMLALGALALDGSVQAVRGILPAIQAAIAAGISEFAVAADNAREAEYTGAGRVHVLAHVSELPELMVVSRAGGRYRTAMPDVPRGIGAGEIHPAPGSRLDYSDFRADKALMRALIVAAAGRHHLLLIGPPGSGKTMAALRFPSLLPDLDRGTALELTGIASLAGIARGRGIFDARPPFRAPHHSASLEGMVGGGRFLRPGEISLSHGGVLFLDETPEFGREVLQSLREPLEDGNICVVRAGRSARYPADFQLILAANQCPCGNLGRKGAHGSLCLCSDQEIRQYWKRLGGPLMDRVDMRIPMSPIALNDLDGQGSSEGGQPFDAGAALAAIGSARQQQISRSAVAGVASNARLPPAAISLVCALDTDAREQFDAAVRLHGISSRACHSVLRVARTIADLDGKVRIDVHAVNEALGYRIAGEGEGILQI